MQFYMLLCNVNHYKKYVKCTAFSLKTESHFSFMIYFFSHKIAPRKSYIPMYLRCPTLIQKQVSKNILFFAVGITFFIVNVSDLHMLY